MKSYDYFSFARNHSTRGSLASVPCHEGDLSVASILPLAIVAEMLLASILGQSVSLIPFQSLSNKVESTKEYSFDCFGDSCCCNIRYVLKVFCECLLRVFGLGRDST